MEKMCLLSAGENTSLKSEIWKSYAQSFTGICINVNEGWFDFILILVVGAMR